MKVILGYLDPGLFYKVTLDRMKVHRINSAKDILNTLQYSGIFMDILVYNLTLGRWENGKISIERGQDIKLNIVISNEKLLEEDVIDFADFYTTKRFEIMREDAKNKLDKDDNELIRALNIYN